MQLNFEFASVDLDLYLYASDETLITSSNSRDSIEELNKLCTYDGVYYVVVSWYSGFLGTGYKLTITREIPPTQPTTPTTPSTPQITEQNTGYKIRNIMYILGGALVLFLTIYASSKVNRRKTE